MIHGAVIVFCAGLALAFWLGQRARKPAWTEPGTNERPTFPQHLSVPMGTTATWTTTKTKKARK